MKRDNSKVRAMILGLAIGDAMGVPVEFESREKLKEKPVTKFEGYGTHNQPAGTWSDDTSMTLATMDAMNFFDEEIDYGKAMDNFISWLKQGKFTATGETFDIGITCQRALANYEKNGQPLGCGPTDECSCGNGALMRISPMIFWLKVKYGDLHQSMKENQKPIDEIKKITELTHGHPRCTVANVIYLEIANRILDGESLESAIGKGLEMATHWCLQDGELRKEVKAFTGMGPLHLANMKEEEVASGGYCVDTLRASLWCLVHTDNYEDAILKAVNLGNDTDTTAAVTGALAGLYYGLYTERGISEELTRSLQNKELILSVCKQFEKSIYQARIYGDRL